MEDMARATKNAGPESFGSSVFVCQVDVAERHIRRQSSAVRAAQSEQACQSSPVRAAQSEQLSQIKRIRR
jgi:hypothetical protein